MRRLCAVLPIIALLASCGDAVEQVTIRFLPLFAGQPLSCRSEDTQVSMTDLRFYVQDLELVTADGTSAGIELQNDGRWQQADLALLDFEDGSGVCLNGTPDTRDHVQGVVRAGDYVGLRFKVGVPFDRNHADPLQALPPLGDPAMHWHWRAGYKFLRAGVRTPDDGFWIHLGSTGCRGTVRDITGCTMPNRVPVQISDFVPGRDVVIVDLAKLVAGTDLTDSVPSDCSSGPAETACRQPFAMLGLDHTDGSWDGNQAVFHAGTSP